MARNRVVVEVAGLDRLRRSLDRLQPVIQQEISRAVRGLIDQLVERAQHGSCIHVAPCLDHVECENLPMCERPTCRFCRGRCCDGIETTDTVGFDAS